MYAYAYEMFPCSELHRVSEKTNKIDFVAIFGTIMANSLKLYEVHLFSNSPNSRQCTTVLNVDVLNCYIIAKNYQNWSKFDEVVTKILLVLFAVSETWCSYNMWIYDLTK